MPPFISTDNFPALKDAEGKLDAKRSELATIFAEAGPELDLSKVKTVAGDSHAKAAHIRSLNDEMEALGKDVADLKAVARAAAEVADPHLGKDPEGAPDGRKAMSLGDHFVKSAAFKTKGAISTLDIEVKTLMTTSAGFAPETFRTGLVVPNAQRPLQVAQIIPQTTTAQAAVVYMEETTFTNSAAETAEAGTYVESALAYTERTSTVQKIATFIPVTDEQLDDESQVRGLLDTRLPFMLRQRLDSQLLNGNGTSPNLRGVYNVSGIQTQAKGTDPGPDAIYKAIVKCQTGTGQAMPDYVVLNPTDWQNIRLLRTADGIYIWGNPSDVGASTLWGLPVLVAQAATAGTGIVGDWGNFSQLVVRKGVEVQTSNSHSTYFVEGKQAVRCDMRAAFVVYRPAAFCTVTGL